MGGGGFALRVLVGAGAAPEGDKEADIGEGGMAIGRSGTNASGANWESDCSDKSVAQMAAGPLFQGERDRNNPLNA